jgi:hypothetical protein
MYPLFPHKRKSIIYFVCVCVCVCVESVFQNAKCMRHITSLPVASTVLSYFSTLSHKQHFWEELFNIKCVLIFSTAFYLKYFS